MQGAGNDPVIGYLIGRTNKTGSGTSEATDATITNCAYRAWDTNDDPIGNIWGSVSGIKFSPRPIPSSCNRHPK